MKAVVFDSCVTSPPSREVRSLHARLLRELGGVNPAAPGRRAAKAAAVIEDARASVAALIGVDPARLIFTSSGTEANNLAVKGFIAARPGTGGGRAVTTFYEHSSVSAPLRSAAAAAGWKVERVPAGAGPRGLEGLENALKAAGRVSLAAFILASPETGALYPVAEMSALARAAGAAVHCDACAAAGRIAVSAETLGVDMMSVSAHKFGGPAGVGALFVRAGVRVFPLLEGGVEERGMRGGFYDTPAIGAAGLAARIALERMGERCDRLRRLKAFLYEALNSRLAGRIRWVSGPDSPLPFHSSMIIDGLNSESLIASLAEDGIEVSPYSWCLSASKVPDSLIHSGISAGEAEGYVRICLGEGNNEKEISKLAARIAKAAAEKQR